MMCEFDKYARDGKCDVCGKETKVVVHASTMGPVSLAYCEDCHVNKAEPYGFMAAYIVCAGEWPNGIAPRVQEQVRRLLVFHRKTEEEFSKDISALREAEAVE